jgi:SIR2-like domain
MATKSDQTAAQTEESAIPNTATPVAKPDPSVQILKSRDDKNPIFFTQQIDPETGDDCFTLNEGAQCSWLQDKGRTFSASKLRERIEPWLTALFQSEHLSLLVGSGLSHATHQMATGKHLPGMRSVTFSDFATEINAASLKSAEMAGRKEGNIEDQIRVTNELLRGLDILSESPLATVKELADKGTNLEKHLTTVLKEFADSILAGEHNLITADIKSRERAFNYLVSFLMSFASRTGTRDRLQIFTTNYDRYIEAGADLAGLHLLDRFVGSLSPIFRSSRLDVDMHYNPPGIRGEPRYLEGVAKFCKLHGSLDWVDVDRNILRMALPFGSKTVEPYLNAPGLGGADAHKIMIYPNSAKDRETAAYPYVELFRDFASSICRPNSTIVCFGYSFGDEHINRAVEDMLTIPSTHLVVIAHGDPLGRIMELYDRLGRHAQITLLIGNHLGNLAALVDNYLPKPAIDRTTMRMSELLKSRWSSGHSTPVSPEATQDNVNKDSI